MATKQFTAEVEKTDTLRNVVFYKVSSVDGTEKDFYEWLAAQPKGTAGWWFPEVGHGRVRTKSTVKLSSAPVYPMLERYRTGQWG